MGHLLWLVNRWTQTPDTKLVFRGLCNSYSRVIYGSKPTESQGNSLGMRFVDVAINP